MLMTFFSPRFFKRGESKGRVPFPPPFRKKEGVQGESFRIYNKNKKVSLKETINDY
jgi:hypothetical protein